MANLIECPFCDSTESRMTTWTQTEDEHGKRVRKNYYAIQCQRCMSCGAMGVDQDQAKMGWQLRGGSIQELAP